MAPGRTGSHRKPVLAPHCAFIVVRLRQKPHLTLHALKDELACAGSRSRTRRCVGLNTLFPVRPRRLTGGLAPDTAMRACANCSGEAIAAAGRCVPAVIASLVKICKLHGVDRYADLAPTITRIVNGNPNGRLV